MWVSISYAGNDEALCLQHCFIVACGKYDVKKTYILNIQAQHKNNNNENEKILRLISVEKPTWL